MDKGDYGMNKWAMITTGLALAAQTALAASPIPTFDKEAVTDHLYARTGDIEMTEPSKEPYQEGNTGTQDAPAFYVKEIHLIGKDLPKETEGLTTLLASYSHRSLQVSEMDTLVRQLTDYYRGQGYTVPQAVIPPQEVKKGVLEIRVYLAYYDTVQVASNTSDVANGVVKRYINRLKPGTRIQDRQLEKSLNNINDLPGVIARATLVPGSQEETTGVSIDVMRRPVWNNYIFTDNGGGYYSGRWRYGFHTEMNNLFHGGEKFILSGMKTSHDMKNYSVLYETPVGNDGTRWGIGYNQTTYDLNTNDLYDSYGKSKGLSFYGLTPLYRNRNNRLTAIYGYDHRNITNELRFKQFDLGTMRISDKKADVYHVGISGSQYQKNQFMSYNLIYWYGDMAMKHGTSDTDGTYHKLTSDIFSIWYDGKWNYRLMLHGQLANRSLDGSEQFFLGGMNGVRAYGSSEAYGDYGWQGTYEIRRQTGIKNLEAALFIDGGSVWNKSDHIQEHLYGWGIGLRYNKDNDWNISLDYAKKMRSQDDTVEPGNKNGRWWLQVYKMM